MGPDLMFHIPFFNSDELLMIDMTVPASTTVITPSFAYLQLLKPLPL
jgi:hypothetical protein